MKSISPCFCVSVSTPGCSIIYGRSRQPAGRYPQANAMCASHSDGARFNLPLPHTRAFAADHRAQLHAYDSHSRTLSRPLGLRPRSYRSSDRGSINLPERQPDTAPSPGQSPVCVRRTATVRILLSSRPLRNSQARNAPAAVGVPGHIVRICAPVREPIQACAHIPPAGPCQVSVSGAV